MYTQEQTNKFFGDKIKPILDLDISKADFVSVKRVKICDLIPNQQFVDMKVVENKMKGHGLTTPYVLSYNGCLILIDGHHTAIAKMQQKETIVNSKTKTQ